MNQYMFTVMFIGWIFAIDSANITIYGNGSGFVQETRVVDNVFPGATTIVINDLPASIQQNHINIGSDCFTVLTKELQNPSLSENEFLQQNLNNIIKLVGYDGEGKRTTQTKGRLLSLKAGRLYNIDDELVYNPPLTPVFGEQTVSLLRAPSLLCEIKQASMPCNVGLSYFVSGLRWVVEYDLFIGKLNVGSLSS